MKTRKFLIVSLLSISIASSIVAVLTGCTDSEKTQGTDGKDSIVNGGFESSDLTGWTVEYGNAFSDDCISSEKTFSYADDPSQNRIDVNATGSWYLCGKGYDGKIPYEYTGAIRSGKFIIPQDGTISMKLAGGALASARGSDASDKPDTKICYVGIYRASDDRMLARQTNNYFVEHTESYVDANKYALGVYNTDNFVEYSLDLSAYAGEEAYIRIVDNDESYYYGYISVDDIRIGATAAAQAEGNYYVKTRSYESVAPDVSQYEVKNGGFETGSLAGWTIVEGDAFSNEGVNASSVWWNENITYSRDGNYHYGMYKPSATGVMRSSEFVLGGSGYVSYKLGGCADNGKTYLRFMLKTEGEDREIIRLSNSKYWNFQFPYVANGMRLLNLVQYYVDLSDFLGQTMYIEVVDNNSSTDDLGCLVLDSVKTYWEEKPVWYDSQAFEAVYEGDLITDSEYQVINGGFETGDLTGWTESGESIGVVTDASGWWEENLPYNKKGVYLYSGIACEGNKGTLTSSDFLIGGSGYMTFKLGGGGNPLLCYLSVVDSETGEELARFANSEFNDRGISLINSGSNLANMVWYRADLSAFLGRKAKLVLTDNAVNSWGLITADSFVTYYEKEEYVPSNTVTAIDIKPSEEPEDENAAYKVTNGGFESGDLTGWTEEGHIGDVLFDSLWWNAYPYNKEGNFLYSGIALEGNTGTLTSASFIVGGCGYMTFRLGGGGNPALCYVSILDGETGEELARFANSEFNDLGTATINQGSNLANMVLYQADLSEFLGKTVQIRVTDNATSEWGLITVDDFVTYYEDEGALPENAFVAKNILPVTDPTPDEPTPSPTPPTEAEPSEEGEFGTDGEYAVDGETDIATSFRPLE